MRRFTRTPYYSGPDDPEMGHIRGPLQLGETVVIETVGGHDQDYENDHPLRAGAVMEVLEKRHSRQGGPFHIEGIGRPATGYPSRSSTSTWARTDFTATADLTGAASG